MSQQIIKIQIFKDGKTKIVDVCNGGENCRAITSNLERRLGSVDEGSRANTEGLYQREIETVREVELG